MSTTTKCSSCGADTRGDDSVVAQTCPQCGREAIRRHVEITGLETVTARDAVSGTIKDPTLPSHQKVRHRFKSGADFWRKAAKWVHRELFVNRDRDRYFEKVTDPETGEVIHECDEPLSEHRGHGSDKGRPDSNEAT